MQKTEVVSLNISKKKGTIKSPIQEVILTETGFENDAHAGEWHRQVSLLAVESMEKFIKSSGKKVKYGEFAENITTRGIDLTKAHPLDHFQIGNTELELTQIGKKCHGKTCAIYKETGDCVMPKEGIFCRVIKPGAIKTGDIIRFLPKIYKIYILTLSDRASNGIYEDQSGPKIKEMMENHYHVNGRNTEIEVHVIPDEGQRLDLIISLAVKTGTDIIITTGGTGLGPKDITIETVLPMLGKQIPGIMEFIRVKYGKDKPNALTSRSIAGLIGKSLIFCLPGSRRAVEEYMTEILKALDHMVYMVNGLEIH